MAAGSAKPRTLDTSEWISKSEAARLRGVSRQAIWELVKRGRLKPSTFGGRAYLKRSEVLKFKYGKRGPYSRIPGAELLARLNLKKKYDPRKWLSVSEAAKALGITHPAVAELIRKRRLKTMMVAERTLVARASVKKIRSQSANPKIRRKKK